MLLLGAGWCRRP